MSTTARPLPLADRIPELRSDFPLLSRTVYDGTPLVYLDNAATTQKPSAVIERIERYYSEENSNIHRGVHLLSQEATGAYEEARERIASFINAASTDETIFVRGCTEGINLVASSFGSAFVGEGDEILITAMEHHSNIVPWQLLCDRVGASLRVVPLQEDGSIRIEDVAERLNERTRLVSIVHISNALGTLLPVRRIIEMAHDIDVPVLLDGAQAIPHLPVDVQELDVDFYTFSGHKMFGPTGVGVLYGKEEWLDQMPPYHGGGDMIDQVSFEKTTFADLPHKFEAGTPNIAGGIGLGEAVAYLQSIGMDQIARYEADLLSYGTEQLEAIDGLRLIGTAPEKAGVLSFLLDGVHPYDAGTVLDRLGIAVRTGHHCTQPVMDRFEIPGTIRASLAFYNTREDIDRLVDGIARVQTLFS